MRRLRHGSTLGAHEHFVLDRLTRGCTLTAWRQGFVIPWRYELREPATWSGRVHDVKSSTIETCVRRGWLAAKLVDSDHITYTITEAGTRALAH